MGIFEKLSMIQAEVSVPKDMNNSFGGYKYRSAEGILEVAKPVCRKYKTVLVLTDTVKLIGERYYVEACACLHDTESEESISVYAYARESEDKKGMDASQITGSTSSYARKYALNGLLNLDDNKDADTDEFTYIQKNAVKNMAEQTISAQSKADKKITKAQAESLKKLIKNVNASDPYEDRIAGVCKRYGVTAVEELKESQYTHCVNTLSKGGK